MSQTLTVNGVEYVPAVIAGKRFGYTRDYILMLSRDGKLDARKVGNKWYVNLNSADKFFEASRQEREERRQAIRDERRRELKSYATKRRVSTSRHMPRLVLAEAAVVIVLAFAISTTGYLGVKVQHSEAQVGEVGMTFFERLALALYDLISPSESITKVTLGTAATAPEAGENNEREPAAAVATTTYTSLVIAPDTVLTTTTIDSIKDSFSDEVSVSMDLEHPGSGIIVPEFKDHEGEAYRFLMVPVTPQPTE